MAVAADFKYENIVIGADFDAVEFAYKNKFVLIKNREPYHHSYEDVEEEWADKVYQLYEMALVPFTDKSKGIRISPEEKTLKVFTEHNVHTVRYNQIHLYDDTNVEGMSLNRTLLHYRVIDWFDCQGLHDLEFDEITTEDKFVRKIKLFKSLRIDGNQKYLDLLCESFLTEEQLKDFNFSDTMARFKVIDLLKQKGIKDPRAVLWKRDVFPTYNTN